MTIALVCTGILAAMLFLLGLNVSIMRGVQARKGGPQFPTDPTDRLYIAIRAHGNASEYVPTLIVLFLLVALRQPGWWASALIVAGTAARLVHAAGLLGTRTMATPSPGRLVGAMGTYVVGVALAVTAVASI